MNSHEFEQEQHRVYGEAIARNVPALKIHIPLPGEKLAGQPELPLNQVNHQANINIAHGRVHGTVFLEGQPRTEDTVKRKRRKLRDSI